MMLNILIRILEIDTGIVPSTVDGKMQMCVAFSRRGKVPTLQIVDQFR